MIYWNRSAKADMFIYLTGSGAYEDPDASKAFAGLLYSKGINYELDVWGEEWKHDWPTWRAMLPVYLETRF